MKRRSGSALLLLLLVIVLGVLIYSFGVHRNDLKGEEQEDMSPEDCPWAQESLIIDRDSGQAAERPYPEQSQFTGPMEFVARVSHEGESRGQISLRIEPDGMVDGGWHGKYINKAENKDYEVMSGGCEGNIVPSMIYVDENGVEDKSKLFFISKGKFILIVELNEHGHRLQHVEGYLYVTGWINPDMSASGELHLTSDKKSQIIYQWTALPGIPGKEFF
jgi:hypothetical protein